MLADGLTHLQQKRKTNPIGKMMKQLLKLGFCAAFLVLSSALNVISNKRVDFMSKVFVTFSYEKEAKNSVRYSFLL
jgi:hypothetical protein